MKFKTLAGLLFVLSITSACGDSSSSDSESSAVSVDLPACQLTTDCVQYLPQLPAPKGFSGFYKKLITRTGSPLHRGRDIVTVPGAPIWIQAKFSYGVLDADLREERVDIYLAQNCSSGLRKIGQAMTSNDGDNPAIDGVEDTGGRVYAKLSDLGINSLPVGRHRVVLVVPGDNSTTELYITVLDPRAKIAVSDVDGTLTATELAAAGELVGAHSPARTGSAAALRSLAAKGYHIIYLTARPEWLMEKTRAWLRAEGYPAGTVRTTTSKVPASGAPAVEFKASELLLFEQATGIIPSFGIGNKATDVEAYSAAGIPALGAYYLELMSDLMGGVGFNSYAEVQASFDKLEPACR